MKVFKEEQRFTQIWLIVLMVVSTFVPFVILFSEYSKGKMTLNEFIITSPFILLGAGFIFLFKLKTRIDSTGMHYQFFPFHLKSKTILWSDIHTAYVRKYNPLGDYGGWGIKGGAFWDSGKGKAINVSGDIGIQLELKNGKKLLIGTQKESAAKQVLKTYQKQEAHA